MASSAKKIITDDNGKVIIKVWADDPDEGSIQQAKLTASCSWVDDYVALMPDCHRGYGCAVGSVVPCKDAVMPYGIGNDIGCGMCAWNSKINIKDIDINDVMSFIRDNIPTGTKKRLENDIWISDKNVIESFHTLAKDWRALCDHKNYSYLSFCIDADAAMLQLGTLGGGNHFCELQTDEDNNVWFMIHSGSRALGNTIATDFHKIACQLMDKWHVKLPTGINVSNKQSHEYSFLPVDSEWGQRYITMMKVACNYALENRALMMKICKVAIANNINECNLPEGMINIHHNYAQLENVKGKNLWIHRKGATLARNGTVGIIPGSMCTKSYIVKGRGNVESYNSCSHGAGRNFSRKEAKRRIEKGIDDVAEKQLGNVELFGAQNVNDELGSAYKAIDMVMENQNSLVEIVTELTPKAVLKGE